MRRHSKMHDLATGMIQDHKDVQDLKANSRKVNQLWDLSVPPRVLTIYFLMVSGQGGSKPSSTKMSMDGLGTPQDILATQTSDQRSHFLADGWTAPFPSRFPAPPLE